MMRIRRKARGFTLIEVATVAAVASIVFLILLRWLSTLGTVSGAIANSSTPNRNAAYVQARLGEDLSSATVCDPVAGTPLRTVSSRVLELYTTGKGSDGKPTVELVRWSAGSGVLTRTAWNMTQASGGTGTCLPPKGEVEAGQVMASSVYTGTSAWMFAALKDGQVISDAGGQPAACETSATGLPTVARNAGGACYASQVQLNLTLLSGGQSTQDSAKWTDTASPTRIKRVYTLPNTNGVLQ